MELEATNTDLDVLRTNGELDEQTSQTLSQAGLDRDAFLTIFLAQLEHQDPLEPQDASELGAQLATFSQLEQSIVQSGEIRGVNERLDQLIELQTRSAAPATIDPISLIGHEVHVRSEELQAPYSGTSPALFGSVEDGTQFLLIEALDDLGESVGVAVLGNAEDGSELRAGEYRFQLEDGKLRASLPDGTSVDLAFERFEVDEDGNLVISDTVAAPFVAGQSYRFQVVSNQNGTTRAVPTSLAGTVDAVQIRDGQPVLSIFGQEIDPTRIVSIR